MPAWPLPLALLLFGLAGLALPGCQAPSASPCPGPATKDPAQVVPDRGVLLAGTRSCSGRGCHGAFEGPDIKGVPISHSSYIRWLQDDPHANAYHALSGERARAMGARLGILRVTEEPRCLACHVTPQAAADAPWAREERVHGVGCESCHGPAVAWLGPHRSRAWRNLRQDARELAYAQVGMAWLPSLSVRADKCAGCHVGAPAAPAEGVPARDVSHEFLAAGHPRLLFEFGSFLSNLPRHWVEKDTRPDFELRAWRVGQVVSAEASLKLRSDRASAPRRSHWPEFAEYDCYACHHGLDGGAWRQQRGPRAGLPGAPRLAGWYLALVPEAAGRNLNPAKQAGPKALGWSPAAAVQKQALAQLAELAGVAAELDRATFDRKEVRRLRVSLVGRAVAGPAADWDEMEQIALGLAALNEADRALREQAGQSAGPDDQQVEAATRDLLKLLAFPEGHDNPLPFRRGPSFDRQIAEIFARLK
jgi:hypothetical protein